MYLLVIINNILNDYTNEEIYWNVNSGGVFRQDYGENKKEVWSASEVQNKQSATDNTLQEKEISDTPITPNGNVSTTSDSKDTTNSEKVKSLEQENTNATKNKNAELHKKKSSPETVSVQNEHLQSAISSDDVAKVLRDIETIKTNSSKIVDENGESFVVYYGNRKR